MSGTLLRQNNIMKSWTRHLYQLRGDSLVELESDKGKETSKIQLPDSAKVERIEKGQKPFSFSVTTPLSNRPFIFAAEDEATANEWVAKLNAAKSGNTETQRKVVTIDDFQLLSVLGRGTYGKVSLVRHKESGQLFAMKAMSKALLAEDENIEQIITEKTVLMQNRHPFLVSAHFAFQTDTRVFIILNYVPGGELFTRLREERMLSEPRTKLIAAELVLALGYLHKKSFIYRDLKPENVLFDEDGHVQLTDFGYTKKLRSPEATTDTFCGTPYYIAPELLTGEDYSKSVDWWSLGCVIYEMLVGISPFYNDNAERTYKAIMEAPVQFPDTMSRVAVDLIRKLLIKDPKKRLGSGPADAEEIMSHPFFSGLNWQDVYDRKVTPLWKPNMKSEVDTSQFDSQFTQEPVVVSYEPASAISPESLAMFEGFSCTNDAMACEGSCIPLD